MLCPQFTTAPWSSSMDPLGTRSQFVYVESLSTWDQAEEVVDSKEEAQSHQREELSDVNQVNSPVSPFPFREDINKKIKLL